MAQDLNFDRFIDVDNTVIKPSPQRVRNILTLAEKIAVIKAYDQRPMYKKVARMFNCSWEQIKNIITNRVAVMEFYHAAKNQYDITSEEDEQKMDEKQRKIKFLNECVYECIQRLQYHAKMPITEELIKNKALEFLDILRIPGFTPTKKWFNMFKAQYNITLSNKQISIYTKPQSSLDIKDIMAYCTKVKSTKTIINKFNKQDEQNEEYEAKRMRKLNFLQEALKEYMLRVKCHQKTMKVTPQFLRQVARDFNEILKVQDFEPTLEWIEDFMNSHDSEECLANGKKPPLSLDLKDILSYCSRMQNKSKDNTVTLAPKETALQMRILPKLPGKPATESGLKFHKKSIIYLDDQEGTDSERDVKPDIEEIRLEKPHLPQTPALKRDIKPDIEEIRVERPHLEPPPLKIRKIESINNDPELQRKFHPNPEAAHKAPSISVRELAKEPPKTPAKTIIYIQKVPPVNVVKENIVHVVPQQTITNVQIKKETPEDDQYLVPKQTIIMPTNPATTKTPPLTQLRIQQVHHQPVSPAIISPIPKPSLPTSPPPPQPSPAKSEDSEEMPRHVTCFKDVLQLLKPLEEYAMLKENYRAIGLITQLEEVLKNPPEEDNAAEDEEFIG